MPDILKISKETKLLYCCNDFRTKNIYKMKPKLNLEKIYLQSFTNEPDKFMKNIFMYILVL